MAGTREALSHALSRLQQASAADLAGESEDAAALYLGACARLEEVVVYLPQPFRESIHQHIQTARYRVDELRGDASKGPCLYPRFPVEFTAAPAPVGTGVPFKVPISVVRRPFWVLGQLSKSMQSGAFLTPDLYVSKAVWQQVGGGEAVPYLGPKVRYLSGLCDALEPFSADVSRMGNVGVLLRLLDTLIATGEDLQGIYDAETGHKTDGTIVSKGGSGKKSLLKRGVGSLLSKGISIVKIFKGRTDVSYPAYLAWGANVLEQGKVFDLWVQHFSSTDERQQGTYAAVLDRLHRLSAFIYFGPCTLMLRDAFLLSQRYVERSREAASRLLPVEAVVDSD